MIKARFGDGFDMRVEGKSGFQSDTQVADFGGWGDGTAINMEEEIPNLLNQGFVCHNQEFSFLTVELE